MSHQFSKKDLSIRDKVFLNDSVPLGVSKLRTFCRIGVSTKAAGGQLIPRVLSLLSTSNMMASNK